MRDIYLIDFENVASEGLSGITYLSEDDQVIIFYSNNSNRLSMKMHILIGKSVCQLSYFEVTVGGKNALDHQISTWLGYLIGTGAAQRNYYIVSRDMGYKHVANFWAANKIPNRVRCVDAIKSASRLERNRPAAQETDTAASTAAVQEAPAPLPTEAPSPAEATAVADFPVASESPTEEAASTSEAVASSVDTEAPAALPTQEEAPVQPEAVSVQAPTEAEDAAAEPVKEPSPAAEQKRSYRSRVRRTRKPRESAGEDTPAGTSEAPRTEPAAASEKKPAEQKSQHKQPAKPKAHPQSTPVIPEELTAIIAPYPKLQENVLRELIANNKRQVLCNTLRKHLGQEKGLALYNEIKRAAWH